MNSLLSSIFPWREPVSPYEYKASKGFHNQVGFTSGLLAGDTSFFKPLSDSPALFSHFIVVSADVGFGTAGYTLPWLGEPTSALHAYTNMEVGL